MDWQEGRDGTATTFRERLYPRWWVWLVGFAFVSMLAVAYGYAFGSGPGWVTAAAGTLVVAVALVATAPIVSVDDRVLRARDARLPLKFVGRVRALNGPESLEARSTRLDPRAYLMLRLMSAPRCVIVEVTDADDPHPYWLVSAKRPEELATALRDAVERAADRPEPAHTRENRP